MKPTILTRAALTLSGLLAMGIGASILLAPVAFYKLSDVALPNDVNLMNDIRAFGGGLIAAGIFIALGLARKTLMMPALLASVIVFSGFGLARLWAISADGLPAPTYLWVLAIELLVAGLCLVPLLRSSWSEG